MSRTLRLLLLFFFVSLGGYQAWGQTSYDVIWSDLIGCSVSDSTLTKTASGGWGNAAATSLYYLPKEKDGWVEYTVDALNVKSFGLSDQNANTYPGSIDYGFNLYSGAVAYVAKGGSEVANTSVAVGDVLRIERVGSTIYYKKNGTTVHTVNNGLIVPLIVDISMNTSGSSFVGMKSSFGPSGLPVLQWTSVKGIQMSGDSVLRTIAYAQGYADAGAASTTALPANTDGWVEALSGELTRVKTLGLSSSATYTNPTAVEYALQLNNDNVQLYENGVQTTYLGKHTVNSIIKIAREGNQVKYYVDGVLKHTSSTPSTGALYAHVAFSNVNGSLKNIYASFGPGQGVVPDRIEYETLKDLYDSLGGSGWTSKTNWPTSWPRHLYNTQFNNWQGITVQNGDVRKISLPSRNLTGFIPSTIGKLSQLDYIQLYTNHIGGKIPESLSTLTNLTFLNLGKNEIGGPIPPSLGNLDNLKSLYLYNNPLTGTLPLSLFSMPQLENLGIMYTQISGEIPPEIGNLPKIKLLYIYRNSNLQGTIPSTIGNLTTLTNLALEGNSQIHGGIPPEIGNLTNLVDLWLNENDHDGVIPSSLGNLTKLKHLQLSDNRLSGEIPASFKNLTNIEWMALSGNELSGNLPGFLGRMTKMDSLWLYNNHFTGSIPDSLRFATTLNLLKIGNNPLTGTIPEWFEDLPLKSLQLSNTNMEGPIPAGLMMKSSLKSIYLYDSEFTGLGDFSSRADKSGMKIYIENNRIPVTDIERYFTAADTHPFHTFSYGGQQLPEPDSLQYPAELSELRIEAPDAGTHGVYLWEKLIGSEWTDVGHLNESSEPHIFSIASASAEHNGQYRYTVTNNWMEDIHISSSTIDVEVVPVNATPVDRLYNGLITAARWRTEKVSGGEDFEGMYVYNYDGKYQIQEARWGDANYALGTFSLAGNRYRTGGMSYDPNGNILSLKRFDRQGAPVHDFTYQYNTNTAQPKNNRLEAVGGYSSYQYNAIGQMTGEDRTDPAADDQYVEYDVTGKVRKVYSDEAQTQLNVEFLYDDRGFRLAKVDHELEKTTWYIRDASGNVISIYAQEGVVEIEDGVPVENENALAPQEVPVYGSGKLGTLYPGQQGSMDYELTDHLGNVRALLRDNVEVYVATMEDNGQAEYTNPRVQEMIFFENLFETEADDEQMNHTPADATIVEEPSMSAYLFWQDGYPGIEASDKAIGPAGALKVEPGDKIELEVWVRYRNELSDYERGIPLLTLAGLLGNTFAGTGGFEGAGITQTSNAFNTALGTSGYGSDGTDETRPFAYLNYILFDENLQLEDAGWQRVPVEAGFDSGEEGLPDRHVRVAFESPVIPEESGYIYIWVSNESENVRVWFDDLKLTRTRALVVQATDYGAWGDVIREQKAEESIYRYGYQGQFAEKDEETGWNHFELREYDAVVGRFLSVDPAGQFFSPYVGMGNNPVIATDPTGGISPIYDNEGNFLGTDSEGFKGQVLIFDDPSKFVQGMDHNEALSIGTSFDKANLSGLAQSRIFTHILDGISFSDGSLLNTKDLYNGMISIERYKNGNLVTYNDPESCGQWCIVRRSDKSGDTKFKITASNYSYETTVENIRASAGVHEYWSHGKLYVGDHFNNHYKAYENTIKSSYWDGTTTRFKQSTRDGLMRYYRSEKVPQSQWIIE